MTAFDKKSVCKVATVSKKSDNQPEEFVTKKDWITEEGDNMAIITISREIGSGGSYIALKLAETLSYTCVEKEVLNEIAKKMGKPLEDLQDFDQETYNRIGVFFQEALASIAKGGRVFHPFGIGPLDWDGIELFTPFPQTEFKEEEYLTVLKQVIKELVSKGDTIILGRGAAHILRDFPGALHVRLVAAMPDRLSRIMDEHKVDETKAKEVIEQRDEATRKFIADFFDADWSDPHFYHLVLNTSLIPPDDCIRQLLGLVRSETKK